jgi:hypothetical protein
MFNDYNINKYYIYFNNRWYNFNKNIVIIEVEPIVITGP